MRCFTKLSVIIFLIMFVPLSATAQTSSGITASTDKGSYKTGDRVTITGMDEGNALLPVTILVRNPIQNVYNVGQVGLQDGIFVHSFVLGENTKPGLYTVEIKHGSQNTSLQFMVSSGLIQNIPVDESAIKVRGDALGMIKYKNAQISTQDNSITIELDVTTSSDQAIMQEFEIPKVVIDAPESLVIEVDENVLMCSQTETNSARIVNCFIPADARVLKITGTSVIPEFGLIATFMLVVGISGIIILSAKIKSRHGFY